MHDEVRYQERLREQLEAPPKQTDTEWVAPDPPPVPDRILKEIESRRPSLPPIKPIKIKRNGLKRLSIVGVAVFVLLLGWWAWPNSAFDEAAQQRWAALCEDYPGWYLPLHNAVGPADATALDDAGLGHVVVDLLAHKRYDPRIIAGQPNASFADLARNPPEAVQTKAGVDASRLAAAALSRIEVAFVEWDTYRALESNQELFSEHGWTRVAQYVQDTLDQCPPHGQASPSAALRAMILVEAQTSEIKDSIQLIETDLAVLAPLNDPVLDRLIQTYRELDGRPTAAESADDRVHLTTLNGALRPLFAFAQRFREHVDTGQYNALDHASFRDQGKAYAMLAEPNTDPHDIFRAWLIEADRYRHVDEDWRPAWAASRAQQLYQLEENVRILRENQHPLGHAATTKLHSLKTRFDALLQEALVAGSADHLEYDRNVIEREIAELGNAINNTGQELALHDALQQLRKEDQTLGQAPYASPTIDRHWQAERRRLALRLERGGDFQATFAEVQTIREHLLLLIDPDSPLALPPSPSYETDDLHADTAGLLGTLNEHAKRHRELTFTRGLNRGLPVSHTTWSRLRSAYLDRLDQCQTLAQDAQDLDRVIDQAYPIDDERFVNYAGQGLAERVQAWASTVVWADPAVAKSAQPVRESLDALTTIHAMDNTHTLSQLALTSDQRAFAFAAWRRLGDLPINDPLAALATEAQMQSRLNSLTTIFTPERGVALSAELRSAATARWLDAMHHVTEAKQAEAVLAQAPRFHVSPEQSLPAADRFNLLLHEAKQTLAQTTDAPEVLTLTRTFRDQTRDLNDPRISTVTHTLSNLAAPDARNTEDLGASGPARAGWTWRRGDDPRVVIFTRGEWSLTFVRIDPPNTDGQHDSFYICTTELPVGVALDAVQKQSAGLTLAGLLPPRREGDTRKGPRSWVYLDDFAQNGGMPAAVNPGSWIDLHPKTYRNGRPADPSAQHPMNYVSAEAAVFIAATLGCTLPTDQQWQAAYQQFADNSPRDTPNLRDQTWARHAYHTSRLIDVATPGIHWADSDVFIPAGAQTRRDDHTANHTDADDHTLWFHPTPPPTNASAAQPVDLVGNVAELVTTAPVDPSLLFDDTLPIQSRRSLFSKAHKSAFAVVGGSALSPTWLPVDQPQPMNVFSGAHGYADVGFRLAFTAPMATPARQARIALQEQPYLLGQ